MKKTLFVSTPCHLKLSEGYIVYTSKEKQEKKELPIQDLRYLLLEHPHITLSHALLVALTKAKVAVITCDEKHFPIALTLPIVGHYLQAERIRAQCALSEERKALLWQQIIRAKISNQADVLRQAQRKGSTHLEEICRSVDVDNATQKEAQAARYYWTHLFGAQFRRERHGSPPNGILNYGYALLRSVIARTLTMQGLNLTISIHHHNRYNAFALVDDIMEPYRPFIDLLVYLQQEELPYESKITQDQKRRFIMLLTAQCDVGQQTLDLSEAIEFTALGYIHFLQKSRKGIFFPRIGS